MWGIGSVALRTEGGGEPADFDITRSFSGRGYRRLPAACQYLLAAAQRAVDDSGELIGSVPPERRGAFVGTNNAGSRLLAEMDEAIIGGSSDDISPMLAPFFSLSLFAGRLSIEYALRGGNLTITSPRTAGLEAAAVCLRSIAAGRADLAVLGAMEDSPPPGEPGHRDGDVGAVALICARPHPGGPDLNPYGSFEVATGHLSPDQPVEPVLDRVWSRLGQPELAVSVFADDTATGAAVLTWLVRRRHRVTLYPPGPGCLTPLHHLTESFRRPGADLVVVAAAAEGNVAFARSRVAVRTPARRHEGSR